MNGVFYIGATGLGAQQRALEVVANNIANLNTSGFKRSSLRFSELLGAQAGPMDTGWNGDALSGVKLDDAQRVFAEGDLRQTGSSMDVALDGPGFLELMGPAGQAMLWRGGTLTVNADGYLAANNGMALKAMIQVPTGASQLTISPDGKVQAVLAGETRSTDLGQIDVVTAKDETTLKALSDGLFQAAAPSDIQSQTPGEEGAASLVQGSVEGSNVQLADEMVMLLLMQRAYGANAQVVQAGDQLMAIANGLKR